MSLNALLLTLYLLIVWTAYFFTYVACDGYVLALFMVAMSIITYKLSKKLLAWLGNVQVGAATSLDKKQAWKAYGVFFAVTFVYVMIWYVAYYPGCFSADIYDQYSQALTKNFNDWHPSWHTFVFFRLPVICNMGLGAIVFVHLLYFAAVIGFVGYIAYKHLGKKFSVVMLLYLFLNPYVGYCILHPWKDTGFATSCCLCLAIVVDMYLKKNYESVSTKQLVGLGILMGNATFFRHNGILFTFFLCIAVCLFLSKKQAITLSLAFLATCIIIKGPMYKILNVETDVPNRVIETTGLPLAIIAATVAYAPETLDEETLGFVRSVTLESEWNAYFELGNFNTFKWTYDSCADVCEEYGRGKVIKMALGCIKNSPKAALKGLFATTDVLYGINLGVKNDVAAEISESAISLGLEVPEYRGSTSLAFIIDRYKAFLSGTILDHYRTFGMSMIFVLIVAMAKCDLTLWEDWKKLFICLPMFTYNFGTMLFLTGPDSRYFFVSLLACPVLLILLFVRREA